MLIHPQIIQNIQPFGCADVLSLKGEASHEQMSYLDLMSEEASSQFLPDAVAEYQGRPVLYLLNGDVDLSQKKIQKIQKLLANRSEQACLGVIRPGSLEVYPVHLSKEIIEKSTPCVFESGKNNCEQVFNSLASGQLLPENQPDQPDFVFEEIHSLLTKASDNLGAKLKQLDILSLTGRALFFRFLIDRKIVTPKDLPEICPCANELKDCFDSAKNAAFTSTWLDDTFNGDLLPLELGLTAESSSKQRVSAYEKFFTEAEKITDNQVSLNLSAILKGWESLGYNQFQTRLGIDWNSFDFAHIPIGVLSQVYETFSRQWDSDNATQTSVFYTPKMLAQCLVNEAFAGLENPADAKILDPSCGAGIFLVLSFRQLVKARWEKDGKRPGVKTIQSILYNQVRGFDISESALRLAALALYVTAIEVNKSPHPPKSLKFPSNLQNKVLYSWMQEVKPSLNHGFELGSLREEALDDFSSEFDLVIGNPPWSRLRGDKNKESQGEVKALNDTFTAIGKQMLRQKGFAGLADNYKNPDNNPDFPFLWRAMEWAKPNAIVALVLPSRILLKQSDAGRNPREAFLKSFTVTGVINGSSLSDTDVWPGMAQPFMLMFGRNELPVTENRFPFVTPFMEKGYNERGFWRIDYAAAESVSQEEVIKNPWLLKTLTIGSVLDVEVMEHLERLDFSSVGQIWENNSGVGYISSPHNIQQSGAKHLLDLVDFKRPEKWKCEFSKEDQTWYEKYKIKTAHKPREEKLFQPPLLIVPQTPGSHRSKAKSYRILDSPVAFSQSYYGFNGVMSEGSSTSVSLLYLITHSLLFNFYCLARSSRLGVERRTFIKSDLEAFPFPNINAITKQDRAKILKLSSELENSNPKPLNEVDDYIFKLYGLNSTQAQVVKDALAYGAPYKESRELAESAVSSKQIDRFSEQLREVISPSFEVMGSAISISRINNNNESWNQSWSFLRMSDQAEIVDPDVNYLQEIMEVANRTAASRVIIHLSPKEGGGLILAILNQARFWTQSRAVLTSRHILRQHLNAFPSQL
ncbi:MAG: type I restriction-modification system DNA methylase subunit [Rubritalea sp.]|jgi:type I restriction-modification system DNA methylase subunit